MTGTRTMAAPFSPPSFDAAFRDNLRELMRWRRDIRHFKTDPVDPARLARALEAIRLAPSVGLSEPWRIVRVEGAAARAAVRDNFEAMNATALKGYSGDRAALYARLKLEGLAEAPVQLAVFCDEATQQGAGLGAASMPETRAYSVACAIAGFWLALRAEGLGLGWVSILDPVRLGRDLDLPDDWRLVGYLCVGHPAEDNPTPELQRLGWESRADTLVELIR